MASSKETFMKLSVDLDCQRCYKKVRDLICSIPEIKDQEYNEKQNTVKIRVVCCRPERIRYKLRCKGGKSIISIDILEPPKPDAKPKPASKPDAKPKPDSKPDAKPKPDSKPVKPDPVPPLPVPILVPVRCPDWYGYGCPPPPPQGGWWCYYDGCPPGGYGYRPGSDLTRCEYYFNDENATACSIM